MKNQDKGLRRYFSKEKPKVKRGKAHELDRKGETNVLHHCKVLARPRSNKETCVCVIIKIPAIEIELYNE